MVDGGVLESPRVDAILGLHVDPAIPVDRVGIRDGVMMARVVDFDLEVRGRGGHAARPDQCVDSVVVAANLVNQLQNIVARSVDPLEPVVLTFGKIEGGSARNAIADRVLLQGTLRALSKRTATKMKKLLDRTCRHVTKAAGASHEIRYIAGYPQLKNDPAVNRYVRQAAYDLYGKRSVVELDAPIMGAEDFARYLEHVPGAMFRLGVGNKKIGAVYPWHHSKFMADERAIKTGMGVCVKALFDLLES
jgi:amidohydrolase